MVRAFAGLLGVLCVLLLAPAAHATGSRPSRIMFSVGDGYAGETSGRWDVSWVDGGFAPRTGTVEIHDAKRSYGTFNADDGWRPGMDLPGISDNAVLGMLPSGVHTLTAVYSGDGSFAPSSTTTTFTIWSRKSQTQIGATAGQNPFDCMPGHPGGSSCVSSDVPAGTRITFATLVTDGQAAGNATPVPTGTASFFEHYSGGVLATLPLSGGKAQWSTAGLAAGDHFIEARYSGDGFYDPSTSLGTIRIRIVPSSTPSSNGGGGSGGGAGGGGTAGPGTTRTPGGGSTASRAPAGAASPGSTPADTIDGTTSVAAGEEPASTDVDGRSEVAAVDDEGRPISASETSSGWLLVVVAVVLVGAGAAAGVVAVRRRRLA
jgi:hypothetical protein